MKRTVKIIIYALIAVVIIVCAALSYVKLGLPNVGEAPDLKVELTPSRIERGKYLANNVSACIDCHSIRDWSKFSGPVEPESFGTGGEKFDKNVGFPGEVYVPNITTYNLKNWTDGEIYRAITAGVKKDGSAIFPIMPYKSYGKMDKEDVLSIIAYIRTLPEQKTSSPERSLDFPLNFLVNTMPSKAVHKTIPPKSNQLEYGAYLVNSAACFDCHTQQDKGEYLEGMDFAGGQEFGSPYGKVRSANITPDEQTGIGKWTKEQFVSRFKSYENVAGLKLVKQGDFQTVMPWSMYAGMEMTDLEAIYTYLRTLKPIKHSVEKYSTLVASSK